MQPTLRKEGLLWPIHRTCWAAHVPRIHSGLRGNSLKQSDSQLGSGGEADLFTHHAQGDLARSVSHHVIGLLHVTSDVQPGDW